MKILSISTAIVKHPKSGVSNVVVYGLGDDGKVYVWFPEKGWVICDNDFLTA